MDYGFLSILPPVLAVVLAIWSKQVALSLFVGIFIGHLILGKWSVITAIGNSINGIFEVCTDMGNLKVFVFTLLMGSFMALVQASGGVEGFVEYLTEKTQTIKSRKAAMFLGYIIGIVIFIDGLLSILFTGVITRPLTDKFRVSREKLAYICDSTSAPINALIPLNSWGAMLMGLISVQIGTGIISGNAMTFLLKSMPFQFYSIVAVLSVAYYISTENDWGPMKKAEEKAREMGYSASQEDETVIMESASEIPMKEGLKPDRYNMIFPLSILLGTTIVGLLVTGKGSIIKGDGTTSILYAILLCIVLTAFFYINKKVMNLEEYKAYVYKGIGSMMPLVLLLILAFAIGNVVSSLETGKFMAKLVEGRISGAFGPAIVFIMGAIMAFCTGTSWGTFAIMMPIAIPMAVTMDANIYASIGAVVSGGIFGDHCSPLSDTTILSSMASGSDPYSHVKTQLPYALLSAVIAIVLYVIVGIIS